MVHSLRIGLFLGVLHLLLGLLLVRVCFWISIIFYFNESYAVASSITVSAFGVMDGLPLRAKLKYSGYGDVFCILLNWPNQYLYSQIETLVQRDLLPLFVI